MNRSECITMIQKNNTNLDFLELSAYTGAQEVALGKIIPNNVFQTYKTLEVDLNTHAKIDKFRQTNPSFNFHFHDDLAMDMYMAANWRHRKIFEIYKNVRFGAAKADIWRYCILHQYGGIYLDFDSSISFPLNSIPNEANELISHESNKLRDIISVDYTPDYLYLSSVINRDPNNILFSNTALQWLLMFKQGHPVLLNTIELIEKNADFFLNTHFNSVHKAVCNFTGPVIYTVALHKYLDEGNDCTMTSIDFNGLATFKDYSDHGIYANDANYYATKENLPIYTNTEIRLNLGCGEDLRPGYINIDANPKKQGVLKLEVSSVGKQYAAGSVTEILAQDLLEHVGLPTAFNWLKEWCELLKIGGSLHIQTTCFDLMVEALKLEKISPIELNYLLFSGVAWHEGKSHWDANITTLYDWHRCCFTQEQMVKYLESLNMKILNIHLDTIDDLKPGYTPHGLNMTIKAIKLDNRTQMSN